MSAPRVVEPSACAWCTVARRGHGRQYADAVGWHAWEQPSQEQILARMKARRLQLAVARMGALPMPVGGGRTLDVVEEELTGVNLALWDGVQAYARLRLALASAQRGRRELRARVTETNEALDDAVQALRARQVPDVDRSADKLTRLLAPTQALREDEPAEAKGGCPRNVIDGDAGGHSFKRGAFADSPIRCRYCGTKKPETGGA